MSYLVDTNVLLRFFELDDPLNDEIAETIDVLTGSTDDVFICAQIVIEYWAVATRPAGSKNGLGLSTEEANTNITEIRTLMSCLPEPADMADRWQAVVNKHSVQGKQSHDARIAALMLAHGVTHLLTLNPDDFVRYDGVAPVTPHEVLQQSA